MKTEDLELYNVIRGNGKGFYRQERGLIAVWGKEAVQFLNGLITNDVAKLKENAQMSAAFPNAQGRLLATVRVLKKGDKFLFETEEATRVKIFNNLFRFTFAGDFFVEDLSEQFSFISIRGNDLLNLNLQIPTGNEIAETDFRGINLWTMKSFRSDGIDVIVPQTQIEKDFREELRRLGAVELSEEVREILRIENGVPLYGVDMDETTIVPELGIDELISYNKGCYIGQEIIARIHFRGHVAKHLTGLIFDDESAEIESNDEIKTPEGKNAGRVTSVAFSPKLGKKIALAYVRHDYLAEETELTVNDCAARVKNLPFVERLS